MILHSEEIGAGPPLILLHGLFGRARNLAGLARALAPRWRVIGMDLRNHGASGRAAAMDYPTLAGDVFETASALGVPSAAVLGHSMGGKTAMALALLWPDFVTRLVVGDTAPAISRRSKADIVTALMNLPLSPGLRRAEADALLAGSIAAPGVRSFLLQNLDFHPEPRWRIDLNLLQAGIGAVRDWPADLAGRQWDGPARFVLGGASDFVGALEERAIRATFPRADILTVPDAGHFLHAEKPAAFLEATGL